MSAPTRFGKYDLLALLATGGMAEIWLARVSGVAGFEKLVVIKRLLDQLAADPEYVEMFLDEARINARLIHSNIVQVMELGQVEGKYFMAMEYVPGLAVSRVGKLSTKRLGDVPQEVACGIVAQACLGLDYAHDKTMPDGTPLHIVHRDVSPQNLILTFEGTVKVLDFGIAHAQGRKTETRTGLVKGKFAYMSPEQCLGVPLDRRSDVFSLGIVLWELATARRLFKRASTYETYSAITEREVPEPRSLNPKVHPLVQQVILKALRKKPDERYASADELHDALEAAMREAGLRGTPMELARFMEATFAAEEQEQRRLLQQAQRGELGASVDGAQVSAVAAAAAAESQMNYVVSDERTIVDPMPLLGDDSGRKLLVSPEDLSKTGEWDSEQDIATTAMPPPSSTAPTEPRGFPIVQTHGGPMPTIYYAFAAGAVLLIVLIAWLIAR